MHYYQFNIGDYQSHTAHLSDTEDLIYRRLLDWYYLHEIPIPLDSEQIARQIRMRSHSDCIASVLQEYFEKTEHGWIHHRADKEIAKTGDKSIKASASAKARWDKVKDANALPTQSEGNATHNTLPKTHNTLPNINTTPIGVSDSVFQEFKSLRKAKKAPITERAIDGIRTEAEKAGWTLEQAMTECLVRGWTGFKADWVVKPNVADKVHQTVPSKFERDPTLVALDESIKNAKTNPEMIAMIREKLKGKTI
jgi:uncharacterized protein YdaU (DUF1376 family)